MTISIFDLFKIGIGPSSSHTVGPMKAAGQFAETLQTQGVLTRSRELIVELFGSLGATGEGHGTPEAIMLGLEGDSPESVDVKSIENRIQQIKQTQILRLLRNHDIVFDYQQHIILDAKTLLPFHPNGMRFRAMDEVGRLLLEKCYYSVGGGFVVEESVDDGDSLQKAEVRLSYPFTSARELLRHCKQTGLPISQIILANEKAWHSDAEIYQQLDLIWETMQTCIATGCETEGYLPGGLNVRKRAARLYRELKSKSPEPGTDPLSQLDWVTVFALSVNEVNAMGGRVVTAPTNGAAGIIPAVLRYFMDFCEDASTDTARRFLLTAGAIGILYKINASISGAEVGCQGEVGSACSMAAGALTEVLGGTPMQVENAAEIAMEHNLGLTCDPIRGLVQIPCIERNAMAAIKAISSSRMALSGDGEHTVSLDQVIRTMRDTGRDMQTKYKETALGGLAVNVIHIPVAIIEC